MRRLRMQNLSHGVEFPDNNTGSLQILAFRKSHPEFKGRKIRQILQLHPNQLPCGNIFELTYYTKGGMRIEK